MNSIRNELWKYIPGFEGTHVISNYGQILRLTPKLYPNDPLPSRIVGNEIQCTPNRHGSLRATINGRNKRRRTVTVHKLVAELFLNIDPTSLTLTYVDGNPNNCSASNLHYCDPNKLTDKEKEFLLAKLSK